VDLLLFSHAKYIFLYCNVNLKKSIYVETQHTTVGLCCDYLKPNDIGSDDCTKDNDTSVQGIEINTISIKND
jgi:hypothetical protein